MNTETQKVDVLEALDGFICEAYDRAVSSGCDDPNGAPDVERACELRAVIEDLIVTSRDLQEAMDEQETGKFDVTPSKNFLLADARHRAALARIGGVS